MISPSTPILYSDSDSDSDGDTLIEESMNFYKRPYDHGEKNLGDIDSSPSYYDQHYQQQQEEDDENKLANVEHYSSSSESEEEENINNREEEEEKEEEEQYHTDEEEFYDEHEKKAYSLPLEEDECSECMRDEDGLARDGACPKHYEVWAEFNRFYRKRNCLYNDHYNSAASTFIPLATLHSQLPPLPPNVVLDIWRLYYSSLLHSKRTNSSSLIPFLCELLELESVNFHGPFSFQHYGLSHDPSTDYSPDNGFFGPWICHILRYMVHHSARYFYTYLRFSDPNTFQSMDEHQRAQARQDELDVRGYEKYDDVVRREATLRWMEMVDSKEERHKYTFFTRQ